MLVDAGVYSKSRNICTQSSATDIGCMLELIKITCGLLDANPNRRSQNHGIVIISEKKEHGNGLPNKVTW